MKGMAASSALSCGSHNIKAIKKAAYAASYHFLSIVTPVSNASCDTDAPDGTVTFFTGTPMNASLSTAVTLDGSVKLP